MGSDLAQHHYWVPYVARARARAPGGVARQSATADVAAGFASAVAHAAVAARGTPVHAGVVLTGGVPYGSRTQQHCLWRRALGQK